MSVRRLVVPLVVTAVALAVAVVPATASYAVGPTDVYVDAAGTDNAECSLASPCASVVAGIFAAAQSGTTIHVGAGTFDGELRPDALGKSVAIAGDGAGSTTLTANGSGDGFVLEVGGGTTALSDLTVQGGPFVDVLVDGTGTVTADRVVLGASNCNLLVTSGSATLTDSTVRNGGDNGCMVAPTQGEIAVAGGSVSLIRSRVLDAAPTVPGVLVTAGTFTADQSSFDDSGLDLDTNQSHAVEVSGGTATITRSLFHGWDQGVDVAGGTAMVSDSTFQGNVVGVNRDSGTATVVRSTFEGEVGSVQGNVAVAGSVLGSMLGDPSVGIVECNGAITDLGYNLASDDSCAFTQTTSHANVTTLHLDTDLADRGGPVPTVAILSSSTAVDSIPAGARYGVANTLLCPVVGATDLRGVPRPQAGACDAGSLEQVATTTTVQAPATAKPHTAVTLAATVGLPAVGVDGIEPPAGAVTFRSDGAVLCADVAVTGGAASCTTSAWAAGSHSVTGTFIPEAGATLHGDVSPGTTTKVGTAPAFTSKSRATFVVGRSQTFRLGASGSPAARITLVKGRVPAGLTFHAGAGTATLSGKAKASAVGSHSVTVQATNLLGSVRQTLRIVVRRH